MKKELLILALVLAAPGLFAQKVTIPVSTQNSTLLLETDRDNRLRTVYFGKALRDAGEYDMVSGHYQFFDSNGGIYNAAYTPAGTWNLSEPAIQAT